MPHKRDDGKLEKVVRAKWTFDGAESIEEMAVMLEQKADYLRELDNDDWELENDVNDDYAFLLKDN